MKELEKKNSGDQHVSEQASRPEHKPLTAAQNVALTIKVLVGAAIVLGAIMALDRLAG